MEVLRIYGNQVLSPLTDQFSTRLGPGNQMHPKTWKTSNLQDRLTSKWNRFHLVILTTHSALKLQSVTFWAHHTPVKRSSAPLSRETTWGNRPLLTTCNHVIQVTQITREGSLLWPIHRVVFYVIASDPIEESADRLLKKSKLANRMLSVLSG